MLREILARFGIQVDSAPLTRANSLISNSIGQLKVLGGVIAGAFVVRFVREFVSEMIQLGDSTAKTAAQVGISTTNLQAWEFAAERSGAASGSLVKGLRKLQKNTVDAADGLETAVRSFKDLGVEFLDTEGNARTMADLLPDLADSFASIENTTVASARAQLLFGKAGNELLPLLKLGSAGVAELTAEFEALGGGLSTDFLAKAELAQDSISNFELAMRGLKSTIAVQLLPTFTRASFAIARWIAQIKKGVEGTRVFEAALIILGSVATGVALKMLVAFGKPLLVVLAIAAAIALVVFVVDDLLTFLDGGDSSIGRFFDAIGIGAENARLSYALLGQDLVAAFDSMNQASRDFRAWMAKTFQDASKQFDKLNAASVSFRTFFVDAINTVTEAWTKFVDTITDPVRASGAIGSVIEGAIDFIAQPGEGFGPNAPPALNALAGTAGNVENNTTVQIDARGSNPEDTERAVRRAVEDVNRVNARNAQRALTPVAP